MANQKNKSNQKNNTTKKNNQNTKKVVNQKEVKKSVPHKEVKKEEKKEIKNIEPKKEIKKENVITKKEKKNFKLTSKQKDIILVLLVVVLLVVAFVVTSNKAAESKVDIDLPVQLEGKVGFNEITYSEYEEKMNNEELFVVVIVKDGCGYCEMYIPIVTKVAEEYKVPINYINLTHLTDEEYQLISTSNSYLKRNNWGTPTTLFMYGNKVVDSIGGYVEEETFVEFVKKNIKVEE